MIFSQTSTSLIRATAKQQSRVGVRNLNSNTNNAVVSESFAFYPSAGTRTFKKSNNQSFSFYPVSNGNGVAATRIQQGASAAPQKQNQVFKMQEKATTSSYTKTELDALFVQSRAVAQQNRPQQQQLTSTAKESFAFYPTNAAATTKRVVSNSESFAFYASNGATATSRKQATTQIQKTAQAESSEAASNNDSNNNKVAVALGSVFMGALVQGRRSLARA